MKYKLIRKFPSSPEIGTIFIMGSSYVTPHYCAQKGYNYVLSKEEVELSPEFFAPLMFVSDDNVEIYKGDTYWLKTTDNRIVEYYSIIDNYTYKINGEQIFSTKDAAQKWIDENNKISFITKDGVEVFEGDSVHWVVRSFDGVVKYLYLFYVVREHKKLIDSGDYSIFMYKNEADKYVKEQNKLNYKVGEWLLYIEGSDEWLFRFKEFIENGGISYNESYHIGSEDNKLYESKDGWFENNNIVKADKETIERILNEVALHKGFNEGANVKLYGTTTWPICNETKFVYYPSNDGLAIQLNDSEPIQYIYQKGKWLEPIVVPQVYIKFIVPNSLNINLSGSAF